MLAMESSAVLEAVPALERRGSMPLALLTQCGGGGPPRNTLGTAPEWHPLSPPQPHSCFVGSLTPAPIKPLGLPMSLQATPCSIPMLPLLSPGCTPSLGLSGLGSLASSCMGRSLEQVVSVATDPLSLHFVNLNMVTVDLNEESMDALMEGRVPGRDTPLAPMLNYSPNCRLTPLASPAFPASSTAGQTGSVRSLFKGTLLEDCGEGCMEDFGMEEAEEEEVPGTVVGGIGRGKAHMGAHITPKNVRRRRSSVYTSDEVARDMRRGAGPMHAGIPYSPLLVPMAGAFNSTLSDSSLHNGNSLDEPAGDYAAGARPAAARGSANAAGMQAAAVAAAAHALGERDGDGDQHLNLTVPFLEENGYFDMTLQAAAVQLGVGVTTLKKLCRQNGLGRWPYRARCSLRKLRDKMREYFANAPAEERDAADALMGREFSRLACMNVGAIDEAVKQFRQAMFKLEFKARQQLEAARGNAGGRKRSSDGSLSGAASESDLNSIIHSDETIRQQAMLHLRRLLNNCGEELA